MLVFVSGSANIRTTQSTTQGQVTLLIEGLSGSPPCNMSLMINVKSKQCSQVAVSKVNLATNQSEPVSVVCDGSWKRIRWFFNPSPDSPQDGSSKDTQSQLTLLSVRLPSNSSIDIDNATVQCSPAGNSRVYQISDSLSLSLSLSLSHTHTHTRARA